MSLVPSLLNTDAYALDYFFSSIQPLRAEDSSALVNNSGSGFRGLVKTV